MVEKVRLVVSMAKVQPLNFALSIFSKEVYGQQFL